MDTYVPHDLQPDAMAPLKHTRMDRFLLDSHLHDVYAHYPEANRRPVIGLTANYTDGGSVLADVYYRQVVAAGGTPLLIPPIADTEVIINTLENVDGLILTGGGDINPLWCGEEPSPALHGINSQRDLAELLTVRLACNRQIPMLGICRGIQTLVMALGGKVDQDISARHDVIKHSQDADRYEPTHSVSIVPGTVLDTLYRQEAATDNNPQAADRRPVRLFVNSFHHQAVNDPGPHFRTAATAPDGIIEAIESTDFKSIMGVQWHPEWLGSDGLRLFQWLVREAKDFAAAKNFHHRTLTLDSHCDTPMFFPQGVEFNHRDPRILYDLHKMTDGHQDAVVMVAYLPQPKLGETFSQKVDIAGILHHNPDLVRMSPDGDASGQTTAPASISPDSLPEGWLSPRRYADLIFDKLEQIVGQNSDYISIARTPADLYEDKRNGRKSILFGIENGLALEHDLSNVSYFAQRGVVYITLCHNGDNDICDSARGCNTHNGLSHFGRQVIDAMNQEGIMVDLSHASEKSFFDALQQSKTPIVCSHACCRALCDHVRNLTDDQMRALARCGGVMQITLYHGFLRLNGEATVMDAIAHLEHAIEVMGINHVGIGSDFDGDGGVRGLADASEMINLTRLLRQRGFSEEDLQKIWGGNWLRVMGEVQAARRR